MRHLLACLNLVAASIAVWSDSDVVESTALRIELTGGAPTRLVNHLTGESLTLRPRQGPCALLWKPVALRPSLGELRTRRLRTGVQVSFSAAGGARAATSWSPAEDGDILVQQKGEASRAGLYGIEWMLSGIGEKDARLIIPGQSGQSFGESAPFVQLYLPWPIGWEAAMMLIQMERGGYMVWTRDPEHRFKALLLRHAERQFDISFQSHNFAPFAESRAATSVDWRITAYRGDWRVAAEKYRRWMARDLPLTPLSRQQPAWVNDIRFVVIMGMQGELLERLAQRVTPQRTLLYIPAWRRDPYDVNYPDYTADDGFGPFVDHAHRLGFRVMPHVNYFGCDVKHPLYARFRDYQLRTAHDGEPMFWIPPLERGEPDPSRKFAYINPAYKPWRDLLVDRFREVYQRYHIDALHLDQTLVIPNTAGGLIDGVSAVEGNLLFHRELRAALPEVALSGEGLDEITLPYEAFAQRHAAFAVNHVYGSWNESYIACAHPISSYLFLPYNHIYGYLGLSNPSNEGLYRAWKRAYENWGVIPTLSRPAVTQLDSPAPEVELLLEEAALWTRHRLRPDFTGDWSPPVKFRHRGDDGAQLVIRNEAGGGSRAVREDGASLYRYVRGVNRLSGPEHVAGWPAYDEQADFGLRPEWTYLARRQPRDLTALHIHRLTDGVVLGEVRRDEAKFVFDLADIADERYYDFWERIGEAHLGVTVSGRDQELQRGGGFIASQASCGHQNRRAIHAHPPWKGIPDQPATSLGTTFGEYEVELPAGKRAALMFAIGLRDGVNGRSDGVTFIVQVDGHQVFRRHWRKSEWSENEVDLSAFAGRRVRIRFVTDSGPERNASFDWAVWGEPRIRLHSDQARADIELRSPRPIKAVVTAPGEVLEQPRAQHRDGALAYDLSVKLPVQLACLWQDPLAVTGSVDLAQTPFTLSATVGGHIARLPMQHVAVAPGEGVSAGQHHTGLAAHPPNNGRVYADWWLRLPAAKRAVLTFAVALQDGSHSDGCRFLVFANGRQLFDRLVTGPDGWHQGRADITALAGGPVLLSLVVDSEGSFAYDWARWAEPRIALD